MAAKPYIKPKKPCFWGGNRENFVKLAINLPDQEAGKRSKRKSNVKKRSNAVVTIYTIKNYGKQYHESDLKKRIKKKYQKAI
jgi:hypothetical protein